MDYTYHPEKTAFSDDKPVKEVLLNLTGNMWRYIWSMNGVPLSKTDKIKIKQGEITRITLNNMTMMHHPMHLHGHFFRVVNENGDYSPLKHTVNVPPMQKIIIVFDGNEYGDWFFHCHILYHMNSGMARIFSYGTPRDPGLKGHPLTNLTQEADHFFHWGTADVASHIQEIHLVFSNIRNQFILSGEYEYHADFGWVNDLEEEGSTNCKNFEGETTWSAGAEYFLSRNFSLMASYDNRFGAGGGLSVRF